MAKKKDETPVDLLGPIEYMVMWGVQAVEESEAYGMEIFDAIREKYQEISFGSVYASLERLTWKGYVESKLGEPEAKRGGRARKYYRVSGLGKRVYDATEQLYSSMRIGGKQRLVPATGKAGGRS